LIRPPLPSLSLLRRTDGAAATGRPRRFARIAVAACAGATAAVLPAGCGGSPDPDSAGRCTRFCVGVEPARGSTDTVFRFTGSGWIPGRQVTATYGVYCAPGRVCILIAKQARFPADAAGRWVFRFRNGPRPLTDVPQPRGSGGGPVAFRQRTGDEAPVTRTPRYYVDGRLVGRESGP